MRWEILRTSVPTAIAKYIILLLLLNEITNEYGWSNAECEGGADLLSRDEDGDGDGDGDEEYGTNTLLLSLNGIIYCSC